jgi:hypothetical protein
MEVTELNISRVYVRTATVYNQVSSAFSSGEDTCQIVNSAFYDTSFVHSSVALQPFCWALASSSVSLSFYTDGRTPWTSDQPVARPLPTYRTTQTQNKRTPTSMPRVEFEPTIPASKRAKTVHALNRSATVIGIL